MKRKFDLFKLVLCVLLLATLSCSKNDSSINSGTSFSTLMATSPSIAANPTPAENPVPIISVKPSPTISTELQTILDNIDKDLNALKSYSLKTQFKENNDEYIRDKMTEYIFEMTSSKIVNVKREMHLNMNITSDLETDRQNTALEIYINKEMLYYKILSQQPSPWVKRQYSEDLMRMDGEIDWLRELISYPESVNYFENRPEGNYGVELILTPRDIAIGRWIRSGIYPKGIEYLVRGGSQVVTSGKVVQSSVNLLLQKGTYLPSKIDINIEFNNVREIPTSPYTTPLPTGPSAYEKSVVHCQMDFDDFNRTLSIQIPPEAISPN